MLIEIFKEALRLMKKNLNLAQLIFIFFVVMTLFTPTFGSVKINIRIIPMVLVFYALVCAFFAGLFFAFKKSIDYEKDPPKTDNPFELSPLYFAEFFQGVGKYLPKFLLGGLLLLLLLAIFGFGYDYIIENYVEIPQKFIEAAQNNILVNDTKLMEFFNSLTIEEQAKIGKISLVTLITVCIYGYITLLYPIILVTKEDNFFKSFFTSLKYLFKNPLLSFAIFIFFNALLGITGLIGTVGGSSIIISVFAILIQCYLNVWYILSLFVYYEKIK